MINTATQVQRRDFLELVFGGPAGSSPLKKTDEGFYHGIACVTNIGVFPYLLPDGSIRYELRLPEEVFHPDSLETLKGKPLTDDHPTVAVDPTNVQALGVGAVGTEPSHDDQCVYAPLTFHREDAIKAIQGGKRALSCGYTCELEFTSGTKWGIRYDAIQRKIRYNHVALVDKGRAGDDAVLRMDSIGWHSSIPKPQTPHQDHRSNPMKKIRIDTAPGVSSEFEADEGFIAAYTSLKGDAAAKDAALASLQAKFDASESALKQANDSKAALQAEMDACSSKMKDLEKKMKETEDGADAKIDAAVKERLDLLSAATLAGVELKGDETPAAIKAAVILKSDASVVLEGKADAYVNARFDIAVEGFKKAQADKPRKDTSDVPGADGKKDDSVPSVSEAKKKYDQALSDAWKS